MTRPRELLVIAGEVSGDMHAAGIIRILKQADPTLVCYGIGGPRLREAGVETYFDVRDMAVMGIVEVLKRIFFFRRVFRKMETIARERKPDAVLLVDYPGFNLRFAASAHAMGIKVLYYICPQVWAWHRSRIPKIAAVVNRMLVIFPFEKQVFANTTLKVDFVGHPLVSEIENELKTPLPPLLWDGEPHIGILPGSRHHEIDRLLPLFCETAVLIEKTFPDATFIIPTPSPEIEAHVRRMTNTLASRPTRLHIIQGESRKVFRQCRAALVKSGTATMESALIGCPTVIAYKLAPLTYQFAKRVVKIPYIGIANIIANRCVCPELIQDKATPENLAHALIPLIEDSPERAAMLAGFAEIRQILGAGGAAEKAAGIILEELKS